MKATVGVRDSATSVAKIADLVVIVAVIGAAGAIVDHAVKAIIVDRAMVALPAVAKKIAVVLEINPSPKRSRNPAITSLRVSR
jgi:hypothetical protein